MRGRTRDLALVGIVAALSVVLGLIGWTLPNGGRISLAGAPIIMLAVARGWRVGISAGAVAGMLHFLQQPIAGHPASILLDYPVASACLGLAGFFPATAAGAVLGIFLAVSAKFAMHVFSGVVFWSAGMSGADALLASMRYNSLYMLPQLVLDMLVVVPLARRFAVMRTSVPT